MTSPFVIAAITARLRNLLDQSITEAFSGFEVTTLPLNQANEDIPNNGRVNLCLYEVTQNANWRNREIPWQTSRGETGQSPLPLNLYYLLTVFQGQSQTTLNNGLPDHQRLLGLAMSILHDYPVIQPTEIRPLLNNLDNYDQLENIRITYEPLPFDQMLRLFESAQTPYAVSVAYQVSVVLIQSQRPARTPLPVLTIGQNDRGLRVVPSLVPPFPTLTSLEFPHEQASIQIDETLILKGHHLNRTVESSIRFLNPRRSQEIIIPVAASDNSSELSVQIDPSEDWIAGFYNISAELTQDDNQNRTNELSFALAPRINTFTLEPPQPTAEETVTLTIECTPSIQENQQVFLLFGDREISPIEIDNFPTSTLIFEFEAPASGRYFIRLRVDGVDSLLILRTEATETQPSRLIFNPEREVFING